jgi:hypothetical protein
MSERSITTLEINNPKKLSLATLKSLYKKGHPYIKDRKTPTAT